MKFCFSGNQYGVEKRYTETSYNPSQFQFNQLGRKTNLKADYTSSTFIENETINKGFNPAIQFKQFSNSGLSPLELFSSDTQMLVRFYSSDGRFPSKGFHAKYKTGKISFYTCILFCNTILEQSRVLLLVMNKLLFSENIQFEHLGAPIVLQAPPDPSKEDYYQSFGKGYSKSSFISQFPSYWYNSENRLQPNYDSARYKSQSTNSFSDPRFYHPSSFNFLNGKHKSFSQTF